MAVHPTRHDYRDQAARYDRTRGASPSILAPLGRAIEGAPGRRVLDAAGGTGNYAIALRDAGWDPVVVDLSAEMLARARTKGLAAVRADVARLPVRDDAVDAVVNVSALHLVRAWTHALREWQRVLRRGGRLAIMAYTRENLAVHWIFDYFPSARRWAGEEHQSLEQILARLPGARAEPVQFGDLADASMAALCRYPHLLLDPAWRMQTSFFERVERGDPNELRTGLAKLERDLEEGRRPDEEVASLRAQQGDGTIIGWQKP